jgi:hypothetical protein
MEYLDLRSPFLWTGASSYREGIQFSEDVKKNGSMLYLSMKSFRASRYVKNRYILCAQHAQDR